MKILPKIIKVDLTGLDHNLKRRYQSVILQHIPIEFLTMDVSIGDESVNKAFDAGETGIYFLLDDLAPIKLYIKWEEEYFEDFVKHISTYNLSKLSELKKEFWELKDGFNYLCKIIDIEKESAFASRYFIKNFIDLIEIEEEKRPLEKFDKLNFKTAFEDCEDFGLI